MSSPTIGSGCSSTLSDAATITFTAKGTKQDAHVTRDDLLSEVAKIVANKPFATWLTQNKFTVTPDVSADTSVSAIWLSQLIHQQAIDSLFASRHLTVSAAVAASAAKDVVNIFPLPTIYPAFDATFRNTLTARQARTEALLASFTDTSDAAGQAFYNTHKSQFACASGKNVAHILVATQAKAQLILNQLKAGAKFATLAQQDSTDAAKRSTRRPAGLPDPQRVRPAVPIRGGDSTDRNSDRSGALPVRIPRHLGDTRDDQLRRGPLSGACRTHNAGPNRGTSGDRRVVEGVQGASRSPVRDLGTHPKRARSSRLSGHPTETAGAEHPTQRHEPDDRDDATRRESRRRPRNAVNGGEAARRGRRARTGGRGPAPSRCARAALERVPIRFVRTARHPAVDDLARDGIHLEALDLLYDQADDLDTVYAAIADRVVETAREVGEIVYAVPGSPTIAERSVELVRAAGIDVELIPGISFVDLAWWRLGIDPMHGARVVDARAFAVDAAGSIGPMLIAQADSQLVCSEVKLALLDSLPPEHDITVLQRLGLPDERIFTVALADLDRTVEADHLTSLFVDTANIAVGPALARLVALTRTAPRPGRMSVGRRADTPQLAPPRARRGLRGCRGDRGAPRRRTVGRHPDRRRTTRSKTNSATCCSR